MDPCSGTRETGAQRDPPRAACSVHRTPACQPPERLRPNPALPPPTFLCFPPTPPSAIPIPLASVPRICFQTPDPTHPSPRPRVHAARADLTEAGERGPTGSNSAALGPAADPFGVGREPPLAAGRAA